MTCGIHFTGRILARDSSKIKQNTPIIEAWLDISCDLH
jgi:hypothetical protein